MSNADTPLETQCLERAHALIDQLDANPDYVVNKQEWEWIIRALINRRL